MKQYLTFDVDGFFRDYLTNKKRLHELELEYQSIIDDMSMDLDSPHVSGGMPKSSVESKADRRERILAKMSELDEYFKLADKIINGLSLQECQILQEYFIKRKRSKNDVEILSQTMYVGIATMYRKIKRLRRRVRDIVEE